MFFKPKKAFLASLTVATAAVTLSPQLSQAQTFGVNETTFSCSSFTDVPVNVIVEFDFLAKTNLTTPFTTSLLTFTTSLRPIHWSAAHTRQPPEPLSATVQRDQTGVLDKYMTSFTVTFAATYEFKVMWEGEQVGPACNVTFTAGSLVKSQPAEQVSQFFAGTPNIIYMMGIDANDNPVGLNPSDVTATSAYVANSWATDVTTTPETELRVEATGDERVQVWMMANRTGKVDVSVSVSGTQVVKRALDVFAGERDVPSSTISWSHFGQARIVEDSKGKVVLNARDTFGNRLQPVQAENVQFTLTLTPVHADLSFRNETEAPVLTYKAKPGVGPVESKYYVIEFDEVRRAGLYNVSITRGGIHIAESPYFKPFEVKTGFLEGSASKMAWADGTDVDNLRVGQDYDLLITGYDKWSNKRSDGEFLEYILVELIADKGTNYQKFDAVHIGDGVFKVVIRFETSAEHTLHVSIFDTPLPNSAASLYGWAPASSAHCEVLGEGAKQCKAGSLCRFVVAVNDAYGNAYKRATVADVAVAVGSEDPTEIGSTTVQVERLEDGLFSVQYTGAGSGGQALAIAVGGEHVKDSPMSVYVAMSNTIIGLLVGAAIFVLSMTALGYYLYTRQKRANALRLEWERMRRAIYKEYRVDAGAVEKGMGSDDSAGVGSVPSDNGAPTLLDLVKQGRNHEEEDWDDDAPIAQQAGAMGKGTIRGMKGGRAALDDETAAMDNWTN